MIFAVVHSACLGPLLGDTVHIYIGSVLLDTVYFKICAAGHSVYVGSVLWATAPIYCRICGVCNSACLGSVLCLLRICVVGLGAYLGSVLLTKVPI